MVSERQEVANEIAYSIRRELVCCDGKLMDSGEMEHESCYNAELAARIAEEEGKR